MRQENMASQVVGMRSDHAKVLSLRKEQDTSDRRGRKKTADACETHILYNTLLFSYSRSALGRRNDIHRPS